MHNRSRNERVQLKTNGDFRKVGVLFEYTQKVSKLNQMTTTGDTNRLPV